MRCDVVVVVVVVAVVVVVVFRFDLLWPSLPPPSDEEKKNDGVKQVFPELLPASPGVKIQVRIQERFTGEPLFSPG
jgi:hypothetical protein